MRTLLLLAAFLAAACLTHGAEPAARRRSLTYGLLPTDRISDSDKDRCWESLRTLGLCKHDLLATLFTGRPGVPAACCRAAREVDVHCGPFTRALLRSLLPRRLIRRCSRSVITGAPTTTTRPYARRAPRLATGPRVSGGARAPPGPEASASVRFPPPPRAHRAGPRAATHAPPRPNARRSARPPPPEPRAYIPGETSFRFPAPEPQTDSPGTHTPRPKAATRTPAPAVVSGGQRGGVVRGAPSPGGEETPPKPKVIVSGSARRPTRSAPGVFGADAEGFVPTAPAPPEGVRTANPSPKSDTYGTPA
ncbi:hypothetical protein ACP70R_010213 [Stipagrostis hirtigluma subsp. patula]